MCRTIGLSTLFLAIALLMFFTSTRSALAQQTLGGIRGTVSDQSGAVVPDTVVTVIGDETRLTRTNKTNAEGGYEIVDLPIGTYTLTYTHNGFLTDTIPSILVQANRTATVNASLKVGQVSTTVTVEEKAPLMNAADTTNGYVLDKSQIQTIPLPTGSFTGLAILSPGVNAELPSGSGANAGLGNQPIWANGQRDTSNSFLLNGVDASNIFNGKSTSQVASSRIVNNTGVALVSSTGIGVIQTTASPYLAIGQALPTPAPETIQEVRVNTSMYDAQQGSTSGAHIDMSTASGTNRAHGGLYIHHGTNWLNAAPYFFNADPTVPEDQKVPALHREVLGGTLGGALIKDKLFGYVGYQDLHDGDGEIGISRLTVPFGLSDDRSAAALAQIANTNFTIPYGNPTISASQVDPVALAIFNYKMPNGQYMIPNDDGHVPTLAVPGNAYVPGTAVFSAHQLVTNLDWNRTDNDILSLKYYFQDDPTFAPYAYSMVAGFPQTLTAGSQVISLSNIQTPAPNFSIIETIGFARENIYSSVGQPFAPQQIGPGGPSINTFGSTRFPGISIVDILGIESPYNVNGVPLGDASMNIGQGAASQGAFTGVTQNRLMPSFNATWNRGRHTVSFGGSFSYTQLAALDDRTGNGVISSADFSQFLQGIPTPNFIFQSTAFLLGNASRYYRANQTGEYIQDKFQLRPNLSLTGGLRFDWDGGLTEKYGRIYSFDPNRYNYDAATDTITSNGFILAGNNKQYPTKGVSDTTLTGRQWGIAPRLGVAWTPKAFHDKIVVRSGAGIYYDRGELFSYLSPGYAAGETTAGPFGVNQSPPFVSTSFCNQTAPYLGYVSTCSTTLENPWTLGPAPTGNPANDYLPNIAAILANPYQQLPSFAYYDRANKLPYTMNYTFDIQWQPRRDLAVDVGFVGNSGRHEVMPVPFNQPGIATPTNPIHGQYYTYGYTVTDPSTGAPLQLPGGHGQMVSTYEGGNDDLRVPYIGYSAESESYKAIGVSNYNALQTHVEKRLSHGVQVGFSYTWSHALDEQSAMGLFYNGNNPLNPHSAYASSDFNRTHVLNFNYLYQFPTFAKGNKLASKFANGWAIQGIAVIQSGQPYSVIDYTGAVGSIFYGVTDGIINPIVPLKAGCTARSAVTGATGAGATAALNENCFTLPLLKPGDLNGAIDPGDPSIGLPGDTYETNFSQDGRNLFRQAWQRRTDISLVKDLLITERVKLKYTLDVFNLTNTASFDIPIDNVSQNVGYNDFPTALGPLNTQYTSVLPTSCSGTSSGGSFYNCPAGLGVVNKTIGGPRQIQMSLHLTF
ncbi:MAG: carboxypeptidase regulatory-like domain-containing protein [Terriglobia bacterium]